MYSDIISDEREKERREREREGELEEESYRDFIADIRRDLEDQHTHL